MKSIKETDPELFLRLTAHQDFKIFTEIIRIEILDPIRKDLLSKDYETIEERNTDLKTLKNITKILDLPVDISLSTKPYQIKNTEIYN